MTIGCLAALFVCVLFYFIFKDDPALGLIMLLFTIPLLFAAYKYEKEKTNKELKKKFHGFNSYGDAIEQSLSFKKLVEDIKANPESFTKLRIYERLSEIGDKLFDYEFDPNVASVKFQMEFPDLNTSSDNSSWKKLKEKTHNEPFPYDRFICQKAIYNDLIEYQKHLLEGFDVDYFDDSIQIYATVNVKTIKEKSSDKKTEVDEKPLGEPTIEEPSVKVETLVEEPVIENLQEEKASIEDLQVEQPQSSNDIPNTTSKKRNPNDDLKLE